MIARVVLACLLCASAACRAQEVALAHAFDVEGHRGARGLAPENTLAAFRRALALGVTTIETDVGVTKDDIPVISHNPNLVPELVRDPAGKWLTPPVRRFIRSHSTSCGATTSGA